MKKYTVIYGEIIRRGSQEATIVRLKYIDCDPDDLHDEIEKQIGWGSIHYIFYGHCETVWI